MQKIEPLSYDQYYHIYNCGINGTPIFCEATNFEYFLRLYKKYLGRIAETYAWCLMGNHFHFLIKIKTENEIIEHLTTDRVANPVSREVIIKPIHQYFSNLFNSYSQAFNKMYHRHGSLFERPFKRKLINDENYFRRALIYIHNNPVNHRFCNSPSDYSWSSYKLYTNKDPDNFYSNVITKWFDDIKNFEYCHVIYQNIEYAYPEE